MSDIVCSASVVTECRHAAVLRRAVGELMEKRDDVKALTNSFAQTFNAYLHRTKSVPVKRLIAALAIEKSDGNPS